MPRTERDWKKATALKLSSVVFSLIGRVRRTLRGKLGPLRSIEPRQILYCRTDHIGDAFMSVPAIAWLRQRYPAAHITVLLASWSAPLFQQHPFCNEVLVCDPPWWVRRRAARFGGNGAQGSWTALFSMVRLLRKRQFDLCIDARGDPRESFFFGVLTGARALVSRSRHGSEGMADSAPRVREDLHEIDQNLAMLEVLAEAPVNAIPNAGAYVDPFTAQDQLGLDGIYAELAIARTDRVILLHPGAKWVNQWPEAHWRAVLETLAADPMLTFVLTGGPSESALCERIASGMVSAHNLAGRLSLAQTAALMARAELVLIADTGPMHLLNAVHARAVLLFGPTDPKRFAPRNPRVRVLRGAGCCQKQLHERCLRAAPPAASDCMRQLPVEEVVRTAREFFKPVDQPS